MSERIEFGRPFVIKRDRDRSEVSGTGIVADGVLFPDGHAVIHWRGKWPLTTPHPDGLASIIDIHDHGGAGENHIIFADQLPPDRGPLTGIEVRDPCPRCEDWRLIPRLQMDEHYREHHPELANAPHQATDLLGLAEPPLEQP